jgi:3-deoxy-manno-octulosonate cytidylyltransferase (CMP-KDO synthetase)
MKICVIIPCRYDSVRFPGKPLKDLNGKPLLFYPYQTAKKLKFISGVYIATDDQRIVKKCIELKLNYIKTSNKHLTGSDRVAEAFFKLRKYDAVINIQGDEPFTSKSIIKKCYLHLKKKNIEAVHAISKIQNHGDIMNTGVVKVAINKKEIMYCSRQAIPYTQNKFSNFSFYRAVGIYGFKKKSLYTYKNHTQGYLEKTESIELLRLLENNIKVNYFIENIKGPAIDTENDLDVAKKIMKKIK